MKTLLQTLAVIGLLSIPAISSAHNCPALIAEIDSILAKVPGLDEETIADEENIKNVKALRDKGETLHQEGKHGESVEVLEQALKLLQNEN